MIIEKAYEGVRKDHVKDALDLFVDFMAIFVSPPCALHDTSACSWVKCGQSLIFCLCRKARKPVLSCTSSSEQRVRFWMVLHVRSRSVK